MHTTRSGSPDRRAFLAATGTLAGAALAGCLGRSLAGGGVVDETVGESFASPTVQTVRVSNAIGDVTIAASGTGDVDVRVHERSPAGQSGLDDVDVSIDLEDGDLTVGTALDGDATWFTPDAPTTDVAITVPRGAAGPAVTSVDSERGDVTLLGTRGDTVARTGNGDVTASGSDGYLTLHSGAGTVLASDVSGLDRAYTGLGDLAVDLLGLRDDVDVGTERGAIVVGVADDLDLDLLAETTTAIDANLPLHDGRAVGGRLTGRQNDGGHRLTVTSELGDVSLRSIRRRAGGD